MNAEVAIFLGDTHYGVLKVDSAEKTAFAEWLAPEVTQRKMVASKLVRQKCRK